MMTYFRNIIFQVTTALLLVFLIGCSSDEGDGKYRIKVVIEANSDYPIVVTGVKETSSSGLIIRRYYEKEFEAEYNPLYKVVAKCEDPNTLINIKVWVNGKLRKDVDGNRNVSSGPYMMNIQ